MPEHPTPAQLARVPLLADLTPTELATLADRFEVESFDSGRAILAEGRPGYAFYVLAEGTADVSVDGTLLRTIGPGDHFGEIAILDDSGRRTATVVATEPVVAWSLFGTSFRVLQIEHPHVAEALEQAMRERLASGETWRD